MQGRAGCLPDSRMLALHFSDNLNSVFPKMFISRPISSISNTASLFLALISILLAIWIVAPAPAYYIWMLAVATSEWSLWIGLAALISIFLAVIGRYCGGGKKNLYLNTALGGVALIISIYPLTTVIPVARQEGISLSMTRYLTGLTTVQKPEKKEAVYANIAERSLVSTVYFPGSGTVNNGASVIVVHGGSWSGGERDDFPQWNQWLSENGFTVFDIDYRLSPQPNYLTAAGDVKCAVRWIKEHADKFNIDPDRIALYGRSAGGHLALLAAYAANEGRIPSSCSEDKAEGEVRAVISIYGVTDLLWSYDNPANQRVIDGPKTLSNFVGGDPHSSDAVREKFILASPVSYVSSAVPTLLIHGGTDQMVRAENVSRLIEKLDEANVSHKELFIPYGQHGFDYNFYGWGSQISQPVILDFLQKNTRPR